MIDGGIRRLPRQWSHRQQTVTFASDDEPLCIRAALRLIQSSAGIALLRVAGLWVRVALTQVSD